MYTYLIREYNYITNKFGVGPIECSLVD